MNRPPRRDESGNPVERGFVLVGVVMFVLALTILGLSLFSLSGYESQFTARSIDADAAFFSACSGIEHAKFVLAKRESLGAVRDTSLFPDPSIVYARARLLSGGFPDTSSDTTSAIHNLAPGTAIEIRVLAQVGQERRMLQANYIPRQTANPYHRLISATEFVHVKQYWNLDPSDPLYSSMDSPLGTSAGVWQSSSDITWTSFTRIASTLVHPSASVPLPDLVPYFSQFWALAHTVGGGSSRNFSLDHGGGTIPGGPANVELFRTLQDPDNDPGDPADLLKYSIVASHHNPRIDLRGNGAKTAIWLIDHGIRFDLPVDFQGDPGDLLVIVSKSSLATGPAPSFAPAGIWFFSGLNSRSLPVILVSDAQIIVEQNGTGQFEDVRANCLTLFGRSVWLAGCRRGGGGGGGNQDGEHNGEGGNNNNTTLWLHPADHVNDVAHGLIDQLWDQAVLPNSDARFISVAGTWTELDPDHPPVFN